MTTLQTLDVINWQDRSVDIVLNAVRTEGIRGASAAVGVNLHTDYI